ncbi:uncharacterized protein LOC135975577 isoform X2 [Chrysemys picta bellii]|uniref:uncharacterized protein LOC135975577 isoform X2 n=1 Tax=Chrysemys picta bellii TaxID=8478 RepID=UPI0032B2BDC4
MGDRSLCSRLHSPEQLLGPRSKCRKKIHEVDHSCDEDRSDFVCTKCKLVSILEEKVRGLEKRVSTLRCIRENEDFLDRRQEMLLRPQCSEDSEQAQQGQKDCEEVWQHVTSRRRKRSVHAPAMEIQLQIFQASLLRPEGYLR